MVFEKNLKRVLELRDTKGDLKGAQRHIDRLFLSYKQLTPEQRIIFHKESANLFRYKGDLDKALEEYKKGLQLTKRHNDLVAEVDYLRLLGFTSLKRFNKTAKARQWTNKAVGLLEQLTKKDFDVAAANVWALVGNIESTDKAADKAIAAYNRALEYAKKAKFYARVATLLGDLANKYMELGEYQKAERALTEDARLSKKYHRHSYPNALVRLSYLYYLPKNPRRDLKKAWQYAEEALKISQKEGWGREVADAYQRLGKIAWYLGKNTESKQYLLKAIAQYKKVKHPSYATWVKKVMKDLDRGINSHHDYPQE